MSVITLTTDFGTRDWFVGTMKGVILGIHPATRIVDLTHEVPAGDVRAGAFALASACRYFPKGTVHVAVVDPGVGSPRRAIAVRTARQTLVGPDNGLLALALALAAEEVREVRVIENPRLRLRTVSQTFHGRDVFAPVAAHLSLGTPFRQVGPRTKDYTTLDWPQPSVGKTAIHGEVLALDHFGNAITNLPASLLPSSPRLEVRAGTLKRCPVKSFYAAVRAGEPVALVGSTGFLEVAVNGGSAARKYNLGPGERVTVRIQSARSPGRNVQP